MAGDVAPMVEPLSSPLKALTPWTGQVPHHPWNFPVPQPSGQRVEDVFHFLPRSALSSGSPSYNAPCLNHRLSHLIIHSE
jgi:hypothetical protein